MMKRVLCILLALLLLLPAAYADEEKMVYHMEGASGNVGDTVTIVGSVKNAPTCASFRVIMTYDDTVLEVVEGKKLESGGLFIINVNAAHEGKKAVNALAADASKVLEGDMDLFSVTFKIIAETPEDNGTLINVVYQEFFKADLSQVYPLVEQCRIYVGDDRPADSTPEPPDTPDETPDTPAEGEDQPANGQPGTEDPGTPADPAPDNSGSNNSETDNKEDHTPSGSWIVDDVKDEIIHLEENGATTTYTPEYTETPEVGKVTDVILKDENGKEAGSLKVEKQEDGSLKVVEQDLTPPSAEESPNTGAPGWLFPTVAAIAAAAVAIAAAAILISRKRKSSESNENEG